MRIYVASSWRNEARQQAAVQALREAGHVVYDFRNPAPGDHGFGWRQCATPEQLKDPRLFRDEVLTHPVARAGFMKDWEALTMAQATVLVLPCGRSAHLELGVAVGAGQTTLVLLDDPISEPELMYLGCHGMCTTIAEMVKMCNRCCDKCGKPRPHPPKIGRRRRHAAQLLEAFIVRPTQKDTHET
jgi:hypothetical protein